MGVTVTGLGSALGVLTVKNLSLHPSINVIRKVVLVRTPALKNRDCLVIWPMLSDKRVLEIF